MKKNRKFLFDTNALSSFTRESNDGYHAISSKVASLNNSDELYVSILSLYEMEYGVIHTKNQEIIKEMRLAIQFVKDEFQIVPLTDSGAKIFAELKEQYREKKNIGKKALIKHNVDLMIIATAIEIEAVLITNDTKDAIPIIIKACRSDFEWEDWTKDF